MSEWVIDENGVMVSQKEWNNAHNVGTNSVVSRGAEARAGIRRKARITQ